MKPLANVRVTEFEGLGPGPLAGLILAGMGAQVTVVTRPGRGILEQELVASANNPLRRGKEVKALDLKSESGLEAALQLVAQSDALIEGYRPGVMEKLGLGPAQCAVRNRRLIYGRMTGWGQEGPLSHAAGHDLNYVALTGLLSLSANRGESPIVPPTVVGDAAGALGLAFGIACALRAVGAGMPGCVVDGAIVDIVAMLGGIAQSVRATGGLDGLEPSPFYDSPFYCVYRCSDNGQITIGALEPQFYALLLAKLGLADVDAAAQYDRAAWPQLRARLTALFGSRPRAHWCALLEGTDACFAPVLSLDEAAVHPHNVARSIYTVHSEGGIEAASAPRFLPLGEQKSTLGAA